MKFSESQDLLVRKMKAGAGLQHHLDSGLFRLRDARSTRTVHPATVESLVRSGVIIKSLDGTCRLA